MGKDIRTGEVEAVEIGNQIPGQISMEDVQTAQPSGGSIQEVDGRAVDVETGEIQEDRPANVVDLRKKA